jgi:hypothetical protein
MPADSRLRNLVARFNATFATDQCIQGVLADWLEDAGDARADGVRKAKAAQADYSLAAEIVRSVSTGAYERQEARARSFLRRRILAMLPECYLGIELGVQLADLPGIGVCPLEEGEKEVGQAIRAPDESGAFDVAVRDGTEYWTVPCRIGYHVPDRLATMSLDTATMIGTVHDGPQWQWKYALAQPEEAKGSTYEQRERYACKVCGNVPDEYGTIEHGRGCYVVSEDGGGESSVEFDEVDQ